MGRSIARVISAEFMPLAGQIGTSAAARPITEDRVMGVLHYHEAGVKAVDLCRRHGISNSTAYTGR